MIEKKIEVCLGTDRLGNVRVRFSLMLVDNDVIISEQYHSAVITPIDNPDDVRASIEAHLTEDYAYSGIAGAPWPTIPDEEWDKVNGVTAVIQTPAVVEKARVTQEQRMQNVRKV